MAETPRYLIKKGTGRLYLWNPVLARKDDLEEISYEKAEKMIGATKERLKRREEAKFEPKPNEYPILLQEVAQEIAAIEKKLTKLEGMEQARLDEEEALRMQEEGIGLKDGDVKKTPVMTKEQLKREKIDNDKEIQKIRAMTNKADVEIYVLEKFGEDVDKRQTLPKLKEIAEEMRTARIFEAQGEEEEE